MTGKPRIDWVALVLSIAALVISALQWYETRRGGQLASAAALAFQIDTELATHHYGFGVKNAGPGVARIRDVMFYVDGKPVDDLTPAEEAAGLDSARDFGVDLELGDALAPGDINWLVNYRPRNRKDAERAEDFIENHMQAAIDYCTASGDCSRTCSEPHGCPATTAAATGSTTTPAAPNSSRTD